MIPHAPGRNPDVVPVAWLPALLILLVSTSLAGLAADAAIGDTDTPPPIPSFESRNRLIVAEQEAFGALAAMTPRAIHDEYDVIHYDISLSLDIPNRILTGTVSLNAKVEVPTLSRLDLDLFECMAIDNVTVGGSAVFYTREDGVVTLMLGGGYQLGDSIDISCSYHGTPEFPGQPLPFRWNIQNGVPMVLSYSEPYGAPAWWICKDDPKDKATYGIHLTVPETLIAVSNGVLDSVVDNGDGTKTFNWSTDYPMSPYLFSIAVTNFESWTEVYTALDGETTMDVTYWAYPADLVDAQVSWSRNLEMMDFYVSIFGEYPFLDEKYGIAEFQHPGAMEHQTCTSMGWTWVDGTHVNDYVVVHELSHSWVGDMITMTEWSHAWCKEGFGTYCEALYFEDRYGEVYYHNYMQGLGDYGYYMNQLYNIDPPLHGSVYYKGAWVLHMLRHVLGDSAFFAAVSAYVNEPDFRYDVADTDDMCACFEEATGVELSWFFDQWIYNPGYPRYEVGWSAVEADGGYDVALVIAQTHEIGPTFKMPIDVSIRTFQGEDTFVVWDSLRAQVFELHVEGQPLAVTLDPDRWIIRQVMPMGVADHEQMPVLSLSQNYPNPFRAETAIEFNLPDAGPVGIDIFDPGGRRVVRLLDGQRPAGQGRLIWNGTDASGLPVAPGIYYCRLRTAAGLASRPVLRIR